MPDDSSRAFDQLWALYLPVSIAVFVIVAVVLAIVAVRFRSGRRTAEQAAAAPASADRLELAYVLVLAVVAAVLLWRSFEALDGQSVPSSRPVADAAAAARDGGATGAPGAPLTVDVLAARWNWRFTYPGGVVQTGDGTERRPATLVVPAGRPVRFHLTSADVAHALWIPDLRIKYDAIPGRDNPFTARFAAGRTYRNDRCSEFCGAFHDQMVFRVRVLEPAAFDAWLAGRRRASA